MAKALYCIYYVVARARAKNPGRAGFRGWVHRRHWLTLLIFPAFAPADVNLIIIIIIIITIII